MSMLCADPVWHFRISAGLEVHMQCMLTVGKSRVDLVDTDTAMMLRIHIFWSATSKGDLHVSH